MAAAIGHLIREGIRAKRQERRFLFFSLYLEHLFDCGFAKKACPLSPFMGKRIQKRRDQAKGADCSESNQLGNDADRSG